MKRRYIKFLSVFIIIFGLSVLIVFAINNVQQKNIENNIIGTNILEALTEGDSVDISNISFDKIIVDKHQELFYIDKNIKRRVVYNNNSISQFNLNSSINKFGFFENFDIYDKNIPYDRQIVLHVGDAKTHELKEIYHGSHKSSGWSWFSDDDILISYGCGTECQVLYLVNIESNKQYQLQYGVGYEWSPDKKMVLAYHYTAGFGITVGDKFGNILFRFIKESSQDSKLINLTLAVWSSDSDKIALIIRKQNEEKLELLVFDAENDFEHIFQSDINSYKAQELKWSDDNNKIILDNQEFIL